MNPIKRRAIEGICRGLEAINVPSQSGDYPSRMVCGGWEEVSSGLVECWVMKPIQPG
jgi:hypothetical protein